MSNMGFLSQKIDEHRGVLLDLMLVDNSFLTLLVRENILDVQLCQQIEKQREKREKIDTILQRVQSIDSDATYRQFLQALRLSGQNELEDLLSSIHIDMSDLNRFQINLEERLDEIQEFLRRAERRAGVVNPSPQAENPASSNVSSDLTTGTMKMITEQFERCKTVIAKLHDDCNNVARINSDIMEQIQQCDARIRENLNYRKKGQPPPQSSQEVFDQLVKDIAALTKRHSRDAAKKAETKLPSLRLIKQCNERVQQRIAGLRTGLSTDTGKLSMYDSVDMSCESNADSSSNGFHSKVSQPSSNEPVLNSLKQLEDNLQKYISQEIRMTDELRRLLRVRHLQRVSQSYSSTLLREVEETVKAVETDDNREGLQRARAHLDNMATEYDECVTVLERFVRTSSVAQKEEHIPRADPGDPQKRNSRKLKKSYRDVEKSKQNYFGETNVSKAAHSVSPRRNGAKSSTVLQLVHQVLEAHQSLKDELASLKTKYRAELDKKKRDCDFALQRNMVRTNELVMQVKELTAEKEKYKKLYDSTKVRFLPNTHVNSSTNVFESGDQSQKEKRNSGGIFVTESTNL